MIGPSYFGAYWGNRRETAEESSDRISAMLKEFGRVVPEMSCWFGLGRGRSRISDLVYPNEDRLIRTLKASRVRRDNGRSEMENRGFLIGIWNNSVPAVNILVNIGGFDLPKGLTNSAVVRFPKFDSASGRIYNPDSAASLFSAAVEWLNPDWATWSTSSIRQAQKMYGYPVIGWFTYIHMSLISDPLLIKHATAENGIVISSAKDFTSLQEKNCTEIRKSIEASIGW